jgi:IPTL-CTERM motif
MSGRTLSISFAGALLLVFFTSTGILAVGAPEDFDADGFTDDVDTCPFNYNPLQGLPCEGAAVLSGFDSVVATPAVFDMGTLIPMYSVGFDTPPHTLGEIPVTGKSQAPRDRPTSISFGQPTIVEAVGSVANQQMLLDSIGAGPAFEQVMFGIAQTNGAGGYSVPFPRYRIEMDVIIEELGGVLRIFVDSQQGANQVVFRADGSVTVGTVLPSGFLSDDAGQFEIGVPFHLTFDIDVPQERWTIFKDNALIHDGVFPGGTVAPQVRMVRPSLSPPGLIGIDNLYVGVPQLVGACCLPVTGECEENSEPMSCEDRGGTWFDGASCMDVVCETTTIDCNGNEQLDECDIDCDNGAICSYSCGQSLDCNANTIPDECEFADCTGNPICEDCNQNGLLDGCDIADCTGDPACGDCNQNGIPDGCELAACTGNLACGDCNQNSILDSCDFASGQSLDCNTNQLPDECDIANCNGQLACSDCNTNGILDGCELASGASTDLDGDGILDKCDDFLPIPTVSEWGLAILAILLLVAAKLRFGAPRSVDA